MRKNHGFNPQIKITLSKNHLHSNCNRKRLIEFLLQLNTRREISMTSPSAGAFVIVFQDYSNCNPRSRSDYAMTQNCKSERKTSWPARLLWDHTMSGHEISYVTSLSSKRETHVRKRNLKVKSGAGIVLFPTKRQKISITSARRFIRVLMK